jgi:hypothetical protein
MSEDRDRRQQELYEQILNATSREERDKALEELDTSSREIEQKILADSSPEVREGVEHILADVSKMIRRYERGEISLSRLSTWVISDLATALSGLGGILPSQILLMHAQRAREREINVVANTVMNSSVARLLGMDDD